MFDTLYEGLIKRRYSVPFAVANGLDSTPIPAIASCVLAIRYRERY